MHSPSGRPRCKCVRPVFSVSCVSPPLVPLIISSQPCVFSWLVPSPVSVIILFAPSFPPLYKSSVLPVSLSSLNVISVCSCIPRSLFCVANKVFQKKLIVPRSCVPGSPCVPRVTEDSTKTKLPPKQWSSPPASLPLAGGNSHLWNTPPNSAGSRRDQDSTMRQSSSCFDSRQITITPWISQTPRDCVGERGSTGVWEVSGPESKLALWCLRWSRPAHLCLRGLFPVRRFPSAAESPRFPSAAESPRFPSATESPRFPSAPETLRCQSAPETLRCQSAPETLRCQSAPETLRCQSAPEMLRCPSVLQCRLLASVLQCRLLASVLQCRLLASVLQCLLRPALQSPCRLRPALQSPCRFRPALQSPCRFRPALQSPSCRLRPEHLLGNFPKKIWGGGLPAMASHAPRSVLASRVPGSTMASWVPGSTRATQAPRSAMASRVPWPAMAPRTGAALEASCPVLSPCPVRPAERPPPLPVGWCTVRDAPFGRGE